VYGAFDIAYLTTLAVDTVVLIGVAFWAWRVGRSAKAGHGVKH
jgi:hypothetical protein